MDAAVPGAGNQNLPIGRKSDTFDTGVRSLERDAMLARFKIPKSNSAFPAGGRQSTSIAGNCK
jgi:hypothetical protein